MAGMYLTYDEYTAMGGSSVQEVYWPEAEARAESVMDAATLGRLRLTDWSRWADRVRRAMFVTIESLPALDAAYSAAVKGSRPLTSFSNGVNSLGFGSQTAEEARDAAHAALYAEIAALLPVELVSSAVSYNRGGEGEPGCW